MISDPRVRFRGRRGDLEFSGGIGDAERVEGPGDPGREGAEVEIISGTALRRVVKPDWREKE